MNVLMYCEGAAADWCGMGTVRKERGLDQSSVPSTSDTVPVMA